MTNEISSLGPLSDAIRQVAEERRMESIGSEFFFRSACVTDFRRTEKARTERGIALLETPGGSDVLAIIDYRGEVIPNKMGKLWNYNLVPTEGCFNFTVQIEL